MTLSIAQKAQAMAAIDHFVRALALDDEISFRLGATKVAVSQRPALVAALDAAHEAKVERAILAGRSDTGGAYMTSEEVVDVLLKAIGRSPGDRS